MMTMSPGFERRDQDLFDIGQEGGAVHGAVAHHRRGHAAEPQGADEGRGLPVPVRHGRPAALAAGARPQRRAILVEVPVSSMKTSRSGSSSGRNSNPSAPPPQDVRPMLLGGVRGFF